MNRNQKIALGCGAAGCLGLIVVAVAAGLIFYFSARSSSYSTNNDDWDSNANSNRSTNLNRDRDSSAETNDNSSSSASSSSSAASMSDDDKHKLFHAAAATGDTELIRRVNIKIGLMNDDYTPGENYQEFVRDHVSWVFRNTDFIQEVNTPEKARDYVNQHIPD